MYVFDFQNEEMIKSLPVSGSPGGGGVMSAGGGGGPMGPNAARIGRSLALHRSNSSLELPHSPDPAARVPEAPLRREYGSHGTF